MSNFLSISDCTVIGYTIDDESIKDELISTVSYKEIEINSSSFSPEHIIKQSIRDLKIDSIFDSIFVSNKNITHILVDTNKIVINDSKPLGRAIGIKSILSNIMSYLSIENKYKLILIYTLNKSVITNETYLSSGSSILYECDIAYSISNGIIKIVKNRHGKSNIIVKI